jgi:hypothetical protein
MIDIATVTTAIGAASSAVALIDKIYDQVDRFLTGRPDPVIPKEHRQKIEKEGDTLVSKKPDGSVCQRITADDMKKLPESSLRHIKVLEQSMENHYSIWARVYSQLPLAVDPIKKAQTEQQLHGIINDMKSDLDGILQFLLDSGMHLDDHYMHIRSLVKQTMSRP